MCQGGITLLFVFSLVVAPVAIPSQTPLVDCNPASFGYRTTARGFYVTNFPGVALGLVRLYMVAEAPGTAVIEQYYGRISAAGHGRWDNTALMDLLKG